MVKTTRRCSAWRDCGSFWDALWLLVLDYEVVGQDKVGEQLRLNYVAEFDPVLGKLRQLNLVEPDTREPSEPG